MNEQTSEQYLLWTTLNRISENISKHFEKSFRKSNLTIAQYNILLTMAFLIEYEKTPIKLTDLVPFDNGSLANISAVIERMYRKGLVEKIRDSVDQRVVRINLTPLGEKALKEHVNPTTEMVKAMFSVYSGEEINLLISLLNKLSLSLEIEPLKKNMYKKVPVDNLVAYINQLNK